MNKDDLTDPVALAAALIRCPSVTPAEGGAIALLTELLAAHGFACTRIDRGGVANLHARWGREAPVFAFNGHTDVVPPGDPAAWSRDPFGGEVVDGVLWGRGATDMKTGVAAFAAAAIRVVRERPPGSVVLTVTGDEEGDATDGTVAILDWMREAGEGADVCLVGEPTSVRRLGDVMKIGRRGSMIGTLTVRGRQGHTAYPERALNPLPALARICARLAEGDFDEGTEHFQPSTLALASIDTGNPAENVIPAEGRAVFSLRFNDLHSSGSLTDRIEGIIAEEIAGTELEAGLETKVAGEAFLTPPGGFAEQVAGAVERVTGLRPAMTTGGGTSDARFVRALCPVVEFGLVGDTMHQVDERTRVSDIEALTDIYVDIMRNYLGITA